MSPSTMTDQTEKLNINTCKHCPVNHKQNSTGVNNNYVRENTKIDPYDVMLPKNDPPFMKPIRRWEKRVGFVTPLRWRNIFLISLFHIISLGWLLYELCLGSFPKWQSVLFGKY